MIEKDLNVQRQQRSLLSLAEYMEYALFDEKIGYYEQSENFTKDFVTPSLISDAFNTSLVDWTLKHNPKEVIEFGGGLGMTANSMLATDPQLRYRLIEKSSRLKKLQQEKLKYKNISWADELTPTSDSVVILQEVFDCLPCRWLKSDQQDCYEILIDRNSWELSMQAMEEHNVPFRIKEIRQHTQYSFQVLYSESAIFLLNKLFDNLKNSTIIVIDYGFRTKDLLSALNLVRSPIRAYQGHQQHSDFWKQPGKFDLTYDVDFDGIMECWIALGGKVNFYGTLAQFLIEHTNYLTLKCPRANYLLDPRHMGEIFKVLILDCP